MKKTIFTNLVLLLGFAFAQEFEVDGNLRVEGNIIFSDSTIQSSAAVTQTGMSNVAIFNTSSEWQVPANVTSILVEIWGAGGGNPTA